MLKKTGCKSGTEVRILRLFAHWQVHKKSSKISVGDICFILYVLMNLLSVGIVATWDQVCVVEMERRYCMHGEEMLQS